VAARTDFGIVAFIGARFAGSLGIGKSGRPRQPSPAFVSQNRIDAEKAAVLKRAFEYALEELGLVNRDDALTDIVAEKMIEVGATRTSNYEEIARAAIKRLGTPARRKAEVSPYSLTCIRRWTG
jgi:hypothetical protein